MKTMHLASAALLLCVLAAAEINHGAAAATVSGNSDSAASSLRAPEPGSFKVAFMFRGCGVFAKANHCRARWFERDRMCVCIAG